MSMPTTEAARFRLVYLDFVMAVQPPAILPQTVREYQQVAGGSAVGQ